MEKYEKIGKLGEGNCCKIYKWRKRETNEFFAAKKIHLGNGVGVPGWALREIAILKALQHVNIIRLQDVVSCEGKMYVVTEYLDMDLKNYMAVHQGLGLNPSLIKRFLHQILCGIGYCHSHRVLHRDLQPENLLIQEGTNTLKLAGFGSTRAFEIPLKILTEEVVAIWYRAPEILLGSRYYSTPVDVWSVGCIFAEMVNGKVLFGEETEISVLREIFSYLGTPNNETWHGVELSSKFVPATPKCPPKVIGFIVRT
ncbi:cell division control protein 2 homolog isoform X2 [Macadamia integrifolia]|uniref:cell division control protein 2 homolog isoform X2 n=1 Tax=Macadamia integrifolia TaxID=60698 RepID=UPI001C532A85|nr:cell division control protein 2 homolog isoform X2 [Macadamia integrifolia]